MRPALLPAETEAAGLRDPLSQGAGPREGLGAAAQTRPLRGDFLPAPGASTTTPEGGREKPWRVAAGGSSWDLTGQQTPHPRPAVWELRSRPRWGLCPPGRSEVHPISWASRCLQPPGPRRRLRSERTSREDGLGPPRPDFRSHHRGSRSCATPIADAPPQRASHGPSSRLRLCCPHLQGPPPPAL